MVDIPTLCLDIGSGTQDVYYALPGREVENCPKFVLPAPARLVSQRLARFTSMGRGVHLHGQVMGGGFYRTALAHLRAGLPLSAEPGAAASLGDDLAKVESLGVTITERAPAGHVPLHLTDYDPGFWRAFLAAAELDYPEQVVACAQDHGFHPQGSNRLGRFELWRGFLANAGGRPEALVFQDVPGELTRLASLQQAIGGGAVADTGAAAVLGALAEADITARSQEQGLCLVNVGNSHTIAFLVFGGSIHGVYEHHTGMATAQELWQDLEAFRRGELAQQMVFDAGGHGCMTLELPEAAGDFGWTCVLGPRRKLLEGYPVEFPAPLGDMMLAGCFGMLHGLALRRNAAQMH